MNGREVRESDENGDCCTKDDDFRIDLFNNALVVVVVEVVIVLRAAASGTAGPARANVDSIMFVAHKTNQELLLIWLNSL